MINCFTFEETLGLTNGEHNFRIVADSNGR